MPILKYVLFSFLTFNSPHTGGSLNEHLDREVCGLQMKIVFYKLAKWNFFGGSGRK
jgi:hypothetical protein